MGDPVRLELMTISCTEDMTNSNKITWKNDHLLHETKEIPPAIYSSETAFLRDNKSQDLLTTSSDVWQDYTADLYLRQRWIESRFVNNSLTRPLDVSDPLLVKKIWKPEVYFPNAKSGDFQYVSVPNVLIRVHPSGEVLYILRWEAILPLLVYCCPRFTCRTTSAVVKAAYAGAEVWKQAIGDSS